MEVAFLPLCVSDSKLIGSLEFTWLAGEGIELKDQIFLERLLPIISSNFVDGMPEMAVFLLGLYSRFPFLFEMINIFLLPLRKGTKEFCLLSQKLFKLNANNRLNLNQSSTSVVFLLHTSILSSMKQAKLIDKQHMCLQYHLHKRIML
jgi:hypothetical protein